MSHTSPRAGRTKTRLAFDRMANTHRRGRQAHYLPCNTSLGVGQLLIVEARSSSTRAFESVFDSCSAEVAAYLRRRVSREAADDVFGDTFLVAWRRIDEMPERPLPWLLGIAHKTLANHLRRRRRQAALVDHLRTFEAPWTDHEATDLGNADVLGALRRLRPNDREVLTLIAWEGLTA